MATSLESLTTDQSWKWALNITKLLGSAKKIAYTGPQVLFKLKDQFTPSTAESLFDLQLNNNSIPEETSTRGVVEYVDTIATSIPARGSGLSNMLPGSQIHIERQPINGSSRFTMEGVRTIGHIFNYATSKWALGCILTAVILNRTNVYARTRWNLQISWKIRLLLRITPIILLAMQCRELLQSIHCQTSPDFALLRWGNASAQSDFMFNQNGGFLHEMSSLLLLKASDKSSCQAVNMISSDNEMDTTQLILEKETPPIEFRGSLSLLWPLFKISAFSQFVETISCAILGRQMAVEHGMSFFELSLAFTEAEAVVMNLSDIGSLGTTNTAVAWTNTSTSDEINSYKNQSKSFKNANTSPEVLLVGLISAMNHLTCHILAIFNQQVNLRLLNTSIWGLAYIISILGGILSLSIDNEPDQFLFRFPTVCIISFIPHVLIIFGIIGCSIIYVIALLITAMSIPMTEEAIGREYNSKWPLVRRILLAHRNMQANVSFSRINVTLRMDFYTALLRTGISIMSMANKAVYLNESQGINIKHRTWLEDDRLQELEADGLYLFGPDFRTDDSDLSQGDGSSDDISLVAAKDHSINGLYRQSNGYTREMITEASNTGGRQLSANSSNGVGTTERSGRWYMAFSLCLGFCRLMLGCYGAFHLWLMTRFGIRAQPRWLVWMVHPPNCNSKIIKSERNTDVNTLNGNIPNSDGKSEIEIQKDIDIEAQFRRNAYHDGQIWTDADEDELEVGLYRWWLNGGWWGEKDNSGNFVPLRQDEDATSDVSTILSDEESLQSNSIEKDIHPRNRRDSLPFSRESTPYHDTTLTPSDLAQLLDPKTPEQRAEAEALAIHLSNDNIVTRSRFLQIRKRIRTKVLTSTLHRPANFVTSSPDGRLTAEEESQILEHLIITRRSVAENCHQQQSTISVDSFNGIGETGPQCVVCQSSPRCIIVWPCRCLSLCNDCRVTLAMNNFEKCVCCRRDVGSFSRIFVP